MNNNDSKTDNTSQTLWTAEDIARYFGIALDTVYRRRSLYPETLPPAVKVGNSLRWRPQDVDQWVEKRVA